MTYPKNTLSNLTPLERAKATLQAGEYVKAIDLLNDIITTELDKVTIIKAQQQLVEAYEKNQDITKAIEICQALSRYPHPKVRDWAQKKLEKLPAVSDVLLSPTTKPIETGFIPLDHLPKPPKAKPVKPTIKTSVNPTNTKPKSQPEPSGFIPFDDNNQALITSQPSTAGVDSIFTFDSSDISPLPNQETVADKSIATTQIEASSPLNKDTDTPLTTTSTPPEINPKNAPEHLSSTLPITETTAQNTPESYQLQWRHATRAKVGHRHLKKVELKSFYASQMISVGALLMTIYFFLKLTFPIINNVLDWLPILSPIGFLYADPRNFILITLAILYAASPWLIDTILKLFYGSQDLKQSILLNRYKETFNLIRTFCGNQHLRVPTLKILPTAIPIAFTYGCLPRFARIVVSQGLLDHLTPEELATIYARELAHIAHRDFMVMSLATMITQIPYLIYSQSAYWAHYRINLKKIPWPIYVPENFKSVILWGQSVLKIIAPALSAFGYSLYRLFCWPMFWLSRQRVIYSDRLAADVTGNPNALTRALIKMAIGVAKETETQQHTHYLLESFSLLSPICPQQALTLGHVAQQAPLVPFLQWDRTNPYRQWLTINNTHPLMGERLHLLALYAKFWQIEPELDLEVSNLKAKVDYARLVLQGAPFFGFPLGMAVGLCLWLIGGLCLSLRVPQIGWLWGDRPTLWACILIGGSLGIFSRINSFFPDIKLSQVKNPPNLSDLLTQTALIPVDSQPIRLEGQLLGRQGIDNWLGQDLMLQTANGLVKLHYLTPFGAIGNLWPSSLRPCDLVGQKVTVTGWWRRGATIWIDLETLQTKNGRILPNGHPVWSVIIAIFLAVWGVYTIFRG